MEHKCWPPRGGWMYSYWRCPECRQWWILRPDDRTLFEWQRVSAAGRWFSEHWFGLLFAAAFLIPLLTVLIFS